MGGALWKRFKHQETTGVTHKYRVPRISGAGTPRPRDRSLVLGKYTLRWRWDGAPNLLALAGAYVVIN